MESVLEVNGMKEFIDKDITKPSTFDAQNLMDLK